jgi:cytochrome c
VGVHAASDTHYEWPWYGELVGAYFDGHPLGTSVATVRNEAPHHPSTRHLGGAFRLRDEWYFFDRNPRSDVQVLLTLDEGSNAVLATYALLRGGTGDHPITWCHAYAGGRSWYTALGHRSAVWRDVRFQEMLLGGTLWAAGRTGGNCSGKALEP